MPAGWLSNRARGCSSSFPIARTKPGIASSARAASASPASRPDPWLQRMTPGETYDLEQLMALSGEPAPAVLRQLLDLELAGAVARLPGGRFFRPVHGRKDVVVR